VKIIGKIKEGVRAENVPIGETFYYNGAIFLRGSYWSDGTLTHCATQLETGFVYTVSSFHDRLVQLCHAEVRLEIQR
jgi:hypothetical protein